MVRYRVLNSCRIWSPTQLNTPPPLRATYCLYILYFDFVEGGGGERWIIEKVRGVIVHKAGSKIPTWLTVSPFYKFYEKPVKTTFSFDVFIVNYSMVRVTLGWWENRQRLKQALFWRGFFLFRELLRRLSTVQCTVCIKLYKPKQKLLKRTSKIVQKACTKFGCLTYSKKKVGYIFPL